MLVLTWNRYVIMWNQKENSEKTHSTLCANSGVNTLMVLDGMVYNTFSMDDVRKNFNNGVETMDSICFGVIQQIGHSIKHAFSPGFITLFVTQFSLNPTEQNWEVLLSCGRSVSIQIHKLWAHHRDLKRDFHTITNLYTHSVFWTLNQRRHSSMPRRRRRKKGRWSGDQIFTWNHQEIMSFNIQGGYYVWPRG